MEVATTDSSTSASNIVSESASSKAWTSKSSYSDSAIQISDAVVIGIGNDADESSDK